MNTVFPAVGRASPACWSQYSGMAYNRTWHEGLLMETGSYKDDDYNRTNCEVTHLNEVPVTLIICLCGLVGNGTVLWLLGSHIRRNPFAVYILSLAAANFAFLLFVAVALVIFYGPESFCCRLGSRDVTTLLNFTILFAFTTSLYLLTAFSAAMSFSILVPAHWHCHRPQHLPAFVCALLWALSFLLTVTLHFSPTVLIVFILSYILSVLLLILSGLILFAQVCFCSRQYSPGKLHIIILLLVFFFPFFTADFGYWILLRLFDFSVFVFDTSFSFACVNSSINPVIYFLVGSCTKRKFTASVRVAFQRAFEDVAGPQNRGETPRENTVETTV
ncbi:proto-oncogene Mas-like [Apteryx mantelli]|uniref:Proto-oncogene Mas-like n=1 Tax=Apteryx mantelli TaxID=2696672 RepID=A0A8B7JG28_9AVES